MQSGRSQQVESSIVSASAILQQLHDNAPQDQVTLGWVMDQLRQQSFSIILLIFAIAGLAPGIGTFAGLLIAMTTFQMIMGRAVPYFPRFIAEHPLPARQLRRVVPYAIAALRFVEKKVHPRWPGLIRRARLPLEIIIIVLSVLLIFLPLPLSNLAPAASVAMISLSHLEQDGLSLSISLLVGLGTVIFNWALMWTILRGVGGF